MQALGNMRLVLAVILFISYTSMAQGWTYVTYDHSESSTWSNSIINDGADTGGYYYTQAIDPGETLSISHILGGYSATVNNDPMKVWSAYDVSFMTWMMATGNAGKDSQIIFRFRFSTEIQSAQWTIPTGGLNLVGNGSLTARYSVDGTTWNDVVSYSSSTTTQTITLALSNPTFNLYIGFFSEVPNAEGDIAYYNFNTIGTLTVTAGTTTRPLDCNITYGVGNTGTSRELPELNCVIQNISDKYVSSSLTWQVINVADESVLGEYVKTIALKAGQPTTISLIPVMPVTYGVYKISSSFLAETPRFAYLADNDNLTFAPLGFNVHVLNSNNIELLTRLGCSLARIDWPWQLSYTPEANVVVWDSLDTQMALADEGGIELLPVLGFTVPPAGETDSQRCIAFSNYVSQVINRYGSRLKAVEPLNEFESGCSGTLAMAVTEACYNAIKAVSSDTLVTNTSFGACPGSVGGWISLMQASNPIQNYSDILNWHTYPYPRNRAPELNSQVDSVETLDYTLPYYRNQFGITRVWLTEEGFSTCDDACDPEISAMLGPLGCTEQQQADYNLRQLLLDVAAGVERVYVYELGPGRADLSFESQFAVFGAKYQPKLAAVAFAGMSHILAGSTFVAKTAPSSNIRLLTFRQDNGTLIYAVWTIDGSAMLDVTFAGNNPVIYDTYGNVIGGPVNHHITVNESPRFILMNNWDNVTYGENAVESHVNGGTNTGGYSYTSTKPESGSWTTYFDLRSYVADLKVWSASEICFGPWMISSGNGGSPSCITFKIVLSESICGATWTPGATDNSYPLTAEYSTDGIQWTTAWNYETQGANPSEVTLTTGITDVLYFRYRVATSGWFCIGNSGTFTFTPLPKTANPVFSPAGPVIKGTTQVTMSCATANAIIYYTIDGTPPTTSSSVYSSKITVGDKTTLKAFAQAPNSCSSNMISVTYIVPIPGDANGDGKVDVGDLGILAANYGKTSGATWTMGDFTGNGAVDVGDLGILAANYGTNASSADFDVDYAKVFGAAATDKVNGDEETASSICSELGLPLITSLVLMGFMLIKMDE
jgi:hypothetical protein